ncbi:MAG: 16S rRNA (cytidine(1402)-2'-O)-methyltransferase [Alphaproteobacteria bacterium]
MNRDTSEKNIKIPEQDHLRAGLYIVATPIGNLRDITLRALDTLRGADVIACEDTRVSGKLLKAYDISKPLLSYNDHSDEKKRDHILRDIQGGKSVALISDAGCPLISDPGYKLVREARDRNLFVTSIPGASALLTGLQLSGLPSNQFAFLGFLPPKSQARVHMLQKYSGVEMSLITYETGPRLLASLQDIKTSFGERRVCVARELTKLYEEIKTAPISDLITYYKEHGAPKGEIVLVIEPALERQWTQADIENLLKEALKQSKTKQAANYVADITGRPKKEIYDMALKLRAD